MPMKLYGMSVVGDPTDDASLISTGGYNHENDRYSGYSDAIIKLTCKKAENCKWQVLAMKLEVPRYHHVSFFTNKPLNCSTYH